VITHYYFTSYNELWSLLYGLRILMQGLPIQWVQISYSSRCDTDVTHGPRRAHFLPACYGVKPTWRHFYLLSLAPTLTLLLLAKNRTNNIPQQGNSFLLTQYKQQRHHGITFNNNDHQKIVWRRETTSPPLLAARLHLLHGSHPPPFLLARGHETSTTIFQHRRREWFYCCYDTIQIILGPWLLPLTSIWQYSFLMCLLRLHLCVCLYRCDNRSQSRP